MLTIIHHDAHLIVVDKPSGLLSVPGKGPNNQDCVAARVQALFPAASGPLVVHRLDMDTSGVMVLGLTPSAQRELSRQFESRTVDKTYCAIASGIIGPDQLVLDAPMRLDVERRPLQVIDHQLGRPATTHVRVLARIDNTSRVELTPLTGRTHQLRLHLAHAGHPILGDPLYGPCPATQPAPHAPTRHAATRLLLHACSLAITHPGTGERQAFAAPVPF
jgi:tRNA pseudouridine32 synthase / 23S rRNA pseudouridine746 synthase